MASSSAALAERPATVDPALVEQVLIKGDLRSLTPAQKVSYYTRVCESLGLNPLTQPFAYITLNGKEVLYAKRDAAEQLRKVHHISVTITAREVIEGIYVVQARAAMPNGRTDESTGAVPIENVKGEARANAVMKAETKAKRRVTLSICGLGMLDETEVETIPQPVTVEAPAQVERIALPEGTVQILKVTTQSKGAVSWAVVAYVDAHGEQHEAKTPSDPKGGAAALCEQLAQEGVPVELVTRVNKHGAKVIEDVRRLVPSPAPVTGDIVDAEAREAAPLTASDIPF